MKKIGLVPLLYDENNYGGVLQFFALQKVIKKLGYNFDIIKVEDGGLVCAKNNQKQRLIIKIFSPLYKIKSLIKKIYIHKKINTRIKKINIFKKNHYGNIVKKDQDYKYEDYTAIICGSDQIWNPKWVKYRTILKFVPDNVNKIIYAASMGCEEMTESEKQAFLPLVERIQHVSVREHSAKKLINSFLPLKHIEVVLDPTLLLSQEEWRAIRIKPEFKGYVLTYFLGEYEQYFDYIRRTANKHKLKIINIPYASTERIDKEIYGDMSIIDASPEEFLGLIDGAEMIFTDSFHACVFSTLFHKEFFVFERFGSSNMIGRIQTLQENFKLPNRIITLDTNIDLLEKINFSKINEYQENLINKSIGFLEKSLETNIL